MPTRSTSRSRASDRISTGLLSRHEHRRIARLAPALRVLAGRPVVDVGADEQDPPARDLGPAEEAQQLVGLARRHAAGDDVEPGIGAVEHRVDRTGSRHLVDRPAAPRGGGRPGRSLAAMTTSNDGARDLDRRADEALRRRGTGAPRRGDPGAQRRHARRPRRRGVRVPRAQRRRQEHVHPAAAGVPAPDQRDGARARPGHRHGVRGHPRPDGVPAGRDRVPRRPHRRAPPRRPRRSRRPAVRPARGPVRPPGARRADPAPADPRLLPRHAPEARDRPGAAARPRARDPRRAVRGPRPADAARLLRHPRGRSPGGADGAVLVARAVRGRARLRPGRRRARGPPGRERGRRDAPRPAQAPRRAAVRGRPAGPVLGPRRLGDRGRRRRD